MWAKRSLIQGCAHITVYFFYIIFIIISEDVPLVEFMCIVFTRLPGENYLHDCQVTVTVGDSVFVTVLVLRLSSAN